MASILIVGKNEELASMRALILERQHNETGLAFSVEEAIAEAGKRHFDLVFICHTLTIPEAVRLTHSLRSRYPAMKFIRLRKHLYEEQVEAVDQDVALNLEPSRWTEVLATELKLNRLG